MPSGQKRVQLSESENGHIGVDLCGGLFTIWVLTYSKKGDLIDPTVIEKFNDQWSENMIFV